MISADVRNAIAAIAAGTMPVPVKPAAVVVAEIAPPPEEETETLFCLKSVKWKDRDGVLQIAGQFEDVELPRSLVSRALRLNACVPMNDPHRRELLGARGGHHPSADHAVDLDEDPPAPHDDPVVTAFTPLDRGPDRVLRIART
jgi:hypothetical protein